MTAATLTERAPATVETGSDVVLRDGSTVHLRPARPDDAPGVADFLRGLSDEARWFRFLGFGVDVDRAGAELVSRGTGLLAVAGPRRPNRWPRQLHPPSTGSGPSWPSRSPTAPVPRGSVAAVEKRRSRAALLLVVSMKEGAWSSGLAVRG
jgi:hypothetical protein